MPGGVDFIPLWGLCLASVLLVFLSVEIGFRFGRYRLSNAEHETEGPVTAMVGATLGLLAFLLAFMFGLASSFFEARGPRCWTRPMPSARRTSVPRCCPSRSAKK